MRAVGAVVLAAGESRRMGRPKMLLPWESSTVLGTVVSRLLALPLEAVAVVLGHNAEAIRTALAPLTGDGRLLAVNNPAYGSGMLTSVQAGVSALPEQCSAFLLALGDHPAVVPAVALALLARHQAEPAAIYIPTYQGRRGHPVLFPLCYRAEIRSLPPEEGLRGLLRRHPEAVRELPVDDAGILVDLDTPADYEQHKPG